AAKRPFSSSSSASSTSATGRNGKTSVTWPGIPAPGPAVAPGVVERLRLRNDDDDRGPPPHASRLRERRDAGGNRPERSRRGEQQLSIRRLQSYVDAADSKLAAP